MSDSTRESEVREFYASLQLGPDRLQATFFQNYRSDRFEDTVRKRMQLGLEEGRWRILSERVIG